MKKTFIVATAIIICCLTQSFTFSGNTASTQNMKWQNTTWVDPFADAKKLPAARQSLQYVEIYFANNNDDSPSRIYFRVYVNDELQVDLTGPYPVLGSVVANPGDTVKLEISTTPPNGGPNVTVEDQTTNTTIFSQNDPSINYTTFSFTAQAGHLYFITSES